MYIKFFCRIIFLKTYPTHILLFKKKKKKSCSYLLEFLKIVFHFFYFRFWKKKKCTSNWGGQLFNDKSLTFTQPIVEYGGLLFVGFWHASHSIPPPTLPFLFFFDIYIYIFDCTPQESVILNHQQTLNLFMQSCSGLWNLRF